MLRAVEICQNEHAHLRFRKADLVLRPRFPYQIGTLQFEYGRDAIAAGIRSVRHFRPAIAGLTKAAPHTEPAAPRTSDGVWR